MPSIDTTQAPGAHAARRGFFAPGSTAAGNTARSATAVKSQYSFMAIKFFQCLSGGLSRLRRQAAPAPADANEAEIAERMDEARSASGRALALMRGGLLLKRLAPEIQLHDGAMLSESLDVWLASLGSDEAIESEIERLGADVWLGRAASLVADGEVPSLSAGIEAVHNHSYEGEGS